MASRSLLDLPTELLDRVFDYLDWDRTAHLTPSRGDLFRASLTCKHLRTVSTPLIFRHVTLRLEWADGALVEPGLFRLRRDRADLAQHIRCVCISTKFDHGRHRQATRVFAVPEDLDDWLHPELVAWPDVQHYAAINAAHRRQVNHVLRELAEKVIPTSEAGSEYTSSVDELFPGSAEDIVRTLIGEKNAHRQEDDHDPGTGVILRGAPQRAGPSSLLQPLGLGFSDHLDMESSQSLASPATSNTQISHSIKRQIDALAVVMLCLPATMIELVFESSPHHASNSPQNNFARGVAAAAFQVFGHRLESLTIATHSIDPRGQARLRAVGRGPHVQPQELFPTEAISRLQALKTLTLASGLDARVYGRVGEMGHCLEWLDASSGIERLEIWNMAIPYDDSQKIVQLAKGLTSLRHLTVQNVSILPVRGGHAVGGRTDSPMEVTWLSFAISLRRELPTPTITIGFTSDESASSLAPICLDWIMHEAIPQGAHIDLEREQRLMEDFASFLPLWEAESSERGALAAEERKSGALVDAAMCNRWLSYANVRRDQGEWTTM